MKIKEKSSRGDDDRKKYSRLLASASAMKDRPGKEKTARVQGRTKSRQLSPWFYLIVLPQHAASKVAIVVFPEDTERANC